VLAATLLTLVIRYFDVADKRVSQLGTAAVAIAVGLAVTRLVEAYGRPANAVASDAEQWRIASPAIPPTLAASEPADSGGWTGSRPTGWTSPLPASSADDRWGGDDSWSSR
jgi:hypothetical protein